MDEPSSYTDVIDALDEGDPLDVNLRLGFHRSVESGVLQRETIDDRDDDGVTRRRLVDVADYEKVDNVLEVGLEVGLYHDLMLFATLPIVLSQERNLMAVDGVHCALDPAAEPCAVLEAPNDGEEREALFDLDRGIARKRSGLPQVDLGVAWSPLNQHRGRDFSTWTLRGRLSLSTGPVVDPCIGGVGAEGCEPGISEGKDALQLESRWSRRFRYLEPLFGLAHTFQWVSSSGESLFRPAGELDGMRDDAPPSISELTLGLSVIPWEDRERHQRFELETLARASLISSGRDVSPVFDVLGTAQNPHLQVPHYNVLGEPDMREVPFTGVTRVQARTRLSVRSALSIQAARYVRFVLGLGLAHESPHLITGEPACNTDVAPRADDPRVGSCGTGIFDPAHRAVIDAPGHRFRIDSVWAFDLFVSAAGQF